MRITQYTDYGLRTLISSVLILMKSYRCHKSQNTMHLSPNHLMKVTQQLTKLGYVESVRGRNGDSD